MKRIVMGLATGALGMLLLAPCVNAQSSEDMHADRGAIAAGHERIHHDRRELRHDLRNGDYGAASREQAEMNHRREKVRERREDLNNDVANRYYGNRDYDYGNGHHGWRQHHDNDDE